MKRNIYMYCLSFLGLLTGLTAAAQSEQAVAGITVENPTMTRNAALMTVSMDIDLSQLELKRNRAAVFVPVIVNGDNRQELPAVGVYGRTRWYQYVRSGEEAVSGADETSYRYSRRPSVVSYNYNVPYAEWMDGSELVMLRRDYGCCSVLGGESGSCLSGFTDESRELFVPVLHYVRPRAEVKSRELSGHAFIDFPVNRTELYPDYRTNRAELATIIATIDSVRNDSDITVTSLTIKGFASPEGSYENNARLARGRTESLKRYVGNLYRFADDFISTDYEPEDWDGLRARVEESNLLHRADILRIIDDRTLEPDTRESRIRTAYPEDYRIMLEAFYPALRHSDYSISYTVRDYASVEKIREIMDTAPQKLSLNEMYRLAESYENGSDEFNDVFDTAVRMYPNDETANLNAANAALSRNDLVRAGRCLEKAGTSAEAVYARGVLAGMQGDMASAERLLGEAAGRGIADAEAALESLRRVHKR